jgi:hypothetical protein
LCFSGDGVLNECNACIACVNSTANGFVIVSDCLYGVVFNIKLRAWLCARRVYFLYTFCY